MGPDELYGAAGCPMTVRLMMFAILMWFYSPQPLEADRPKV